MKKKSNLQQNMSHELYVWGHCTKIKDIINLHQVSFSAALASQHFHAIVVI